MDPVFSRPKFGSKPAGYVPGVGRGAVPFFTRSDIGNAASPGFMIKYELYSPTHGTRGHEHDRDRGDYSDTLFDKWSGFADKHPAAEKPDPEDDDADRVYADVDEYLDSRRKRHREHNVKALISKKRKPTVASLFSDVREDLKTVTAGMEYLLTLDEWKNLPDAKPHARKKMKQARKLPITDRVLYQAATEGQVMATDQTSNSDARGSVISHQLDKVGGIKTAAPSVDPVGYLTELNAIKVSSEEEIRDLKKLRVLVKSLIETNPTHAEGWLTAARVEEKDGKVPEARTLLSEGCIHCPDSEDLWIESARLEPLQQGKDLLLKAASTLPHSIKIWLALASKETIDFEKLRVLRQGLEANPESVRLWKEVVQLADPEDARMYLRKAVTCVPQSLELWLALARLETYGNARAVLSKARKLMPAEFVIWIYAAKLEETNGNPGSVPDLISRGVRTLTKNGVVISRQVWLQEAFVAEQSDCVETAKSIVSATLETGLEPSERCRRWLEDAENAVRNACLETARHIYVAGLKALPGNLELWRARLQLENRLKNLPELAKLYPSAVAACPESVSLWLEFSDFESGENDGNAGIQVLERALEHHPADLQLHLRLSKLYQVANDFDKARDVLVQCPCEKAWKRAALLDLSAGRISTAEKTLEEGIQRYPNYPRLYLLLADLFPDPTHKRKSLDSAMRKCPDSAEVWIKAARFEETQGASIKSRYILEKARRHCLNPAVWSESASLEIRLNNLKAAQALVLEGLKTYPKSGVLWAEAIRLEPRQTRKAKTVDALEKCEEAPEVLVEAARLFWEDRKMEKARLWFRKSLSKAGKWGDAVIYFYQFELEQTDSHAEALLQEVETSKYKFGEVWEQTDASKTTAERIKSGANMLKSG